MLVAAYLFEIRQIQAFVFATGKLRDASGASEVLDGLCGDPIAQEGRTSDSVSGLAGELISRFLPDCRVYRAAGGALDLTCHDLAGLQTFRAAFRLALAQRAPGLVYSDSIATADGEEDARRTARHGMSAGGPATGVAMPLGSPIVRPAPRSGGNPAILPEWTTGGTCRITKDFSDLASQVQRRYLEQQKHTLTEKFTPAEARPRRLKWPNVFTLAEDEAVSPRNVVFPFGNAEVPRLAVIHADGNGMGALFAAAVKLLGPGEVRQLSRDLADATRAAVQAAMDPVVARAVEDVVPARPILLGGDDVSVLLRADLAMDFACDFVRAFQDKATVAVRAFAPLAGCEPLTTKVGLVVIGPNQPFRQAYGLAESLASAARPGPGQQESRIAFCRVTTAAIAAAAEDLEADGLTVDGYTLWRSAHSLDQIAALRALALLLQDDDVGRGGFRRVAEVMKSNRAEAHRVLDRSRTVLKQRNPDTFARFEAALAAAGMPDLSHPGNVDAPVWCPLLQAHDLTHIERAVA